MTDFKHYCTKHSCSHRRKRWPVKLSLLFLFILLLSYATWWFQLQYPSTFFLSSLFDFYFANANGHESVNHLSQHCLSIWLLECCSWLGAALEFSAPKSIFTYTFNKDIRERCKKKLKGIFGCSLTWEVFTWILDSFNLLWYFRMVTNERVIPLL